MNKLGISKERKQFLNKKKREKILVIATQILILAGFIVIWEVLADADIIDSFITSKPSRILNTFLNLSSNNLLEHIGITVYETVVGFLLGTIIGIVIAIILWWSNFLAKVFEPYLVVLNSLPKVALRTNHNIMGRSRNTCIYCNGSSNIISCNNIRKLKWIFENRFRSNKNGTNI